MSTQTSPNTTLRSTSIEYVTAREVLNNKGHPVLEVDVISADGKLGRGSASCGISAGRHEVANLLDGGTRFGGLGVLEAVKIVEDRIQPALRGMDCRDQRAIDAALVALDGTADKSALGGNTVCSVSFAVAHLGAQHVGVPLYQHLGGALCNVLPLPLFNFVNGGPYSGGPTDFQEFHGVPVAANSFREAMQMGVEVAMKIPETIRKRHGADAYRPGHLGGNSAPVADPREILTTLLAAIEEAGHGGKFLLSLDCATSHFYDAESDTYNMNFGKLTSAELTDYMVALTDDFPIMMLEDPLDEDDFKGFAALNAKVNTLICGDDLFVTNTERLRQGSAVDAAGAMIFKPNMVGSVTEALDAARYAQSRGMEIVPSQRASTSPGDPTAELGMAVGARLMKVGAPQTGERTAQQNHLMRIEQSLGSSATMIPETEVRQWASGG